MNGQTALLEEMRQRLQEAIEKGEPVEVFRAFVDELVARGLGADSAKPNAPVEVALKVFEFVGTEYGAECDAPVVLEGLFLAIQMLGGPARAAELIRYCSLTRA